jgi:phosphoserine phosphatase
MASKEHITIIDICGTLYDSNTTFDFLDFTIRTTSYLRFRRFSKSIPWRAFNRLIHKFLKIDLTRAIAVSYLKGTNLKDLESKMELFYNERLVKLKHFEVWERVKKLKENGEQLILVSATLDFIAQKISTEIGIQTVYSTKLKFNNLVCEGVIDRDLLGSKKQYLELCNILPPYKSIITDNFSDLEIIKVSNHNVIVTKELNINKWRNLLSKNNIKNYEIIAVK